MARHAALRTQVAGRDQDASAVVPLLFASPVPPPDSRLRNASRDMESAVRLYAR